MVDSRGAPTAPGLLAPGPGLPPPAPRGPWRGAAGPSPTLPPARRSGPRPPQPPPAPGPCPRQGSGAALPAPLQSSPLCHQGHPSKAWRAPAVTPWGLCDRCRPAPPARQLASTSARAAGWGVGRGRAPGKRLPRTPRVLSCCCWRRQRALLSERRGLAPGPWMVTPVGFSPSLGAGCPPPPPRGPEASARSHRGRWQCWSRCTRADPCGLTRQRPRQGSRAAQGAPPGCRGSLVLRRCGAT